MNWVFLKLKSLSFERHHKENETQDEEREKTFTIIYLTENLSPE